MPKCQAIEERKELTYRIASIMPVPGDSFKTVDYIEPLIRDDSYGTEKGLLVMFSVLHGIVNEYLDGGDQMVENCTCGEHQDRPEPQSERV